MDPISHMNEIEKQLCNKADLARIPIAGNIELLPLCNMDCKMCYAKMTRKEMEAYAPMHNYKEWLDIATEMAKNGTMFMLLTGGEPFIYPDFDKLYEGMKKLGFVISINSNGTLIDEKIADWLAKDPPRRINITLYGASDETYASLCGNPHGFSQVMRALKLLKERNISVKLNCSMTPYNRSDLDDIYRISEKLDIPIEIGYYMFPAVRDNNKSNKIHRFTPEEAAETKFRINALTYGDNFDQFVNYALEQYETYEVTKPYETGYTCRAGNSVFWVNYDGTMSACSFSNDFKVNIFEEGFASGWNKIKAHVAKTWLAEKCHYCKMNIICTRCASAAISEKGDSYGVPEYYCKLTEEYIRLLYERKKTHEN